MRTHLRSTLAMLAALALLVAACGGDGDDGSEGADEAADGTEEQGDDDGAADDEAADDEAVEDEAADDEETDAADDEAADDDGDEGDGDGSGDEGLLAGVSFSPEPVRITYELESEQMEMPGEMIVAMDGERVATSMSVEGGMEMRTFLEGDELVASCFGQEGEWNCSESSMGGEAAEEDMGTEVFSESSFADAEALGGLDDLREGTVAGRDAYCGSGGDFVDEAVGEICVDAATGAPLRIEGGDGGSSYVMEAVEVAEATEDDFTPPAEVN
ncbi:MAG: hypothetical protein ACOC9I_00590 [Actinomycetota bacterium]